LIALSQTAGVPPNSAGDTDWVDILETKIKTSSQKDLVFDVALQCGIVTDTTNVRNILCAGCDDPTQPFTTHMSFQFHSLRNRQHYRLRFMPPFVDAPDLHSDPNQSPYENMPRRARPSS
jgi:hypothetical protein